MTGTTPWGSGDPGWERPIDRFLRLATDVTGKTPRRSGTGWSLCCPAHGDSNPSMSVSEGDDGRVLIMCHVGCAPADIVASVGLELRDLFEPSNDPPQPPVRLVQRQAPPVKAKRSEYIYADENSQPLFKVVVTRKPDGSKKVSQHRSMGNDSWANNLGKARRVPYRLPRVLRAVAAAAPVFIVEGEKCVEALESIGLIATTNPGGAGKWSEDYNLFFGDADVVVLPDNDDTGRRHAADIVDALSGIAHSVRTLELPGLPEKGDVADWIADGGSRRDLLEILREGAGTHTPGSLVASRPVDNPEDTWPAPTLADRALEGPLGEAVHLHTAASEAHPAAILAHMLVGFSAMIPPTFQLDIGPIQQPAKLFAVVYGASAKARKGTAWGNARTVLNAADERFLELHHATGLTSGEGLIARLAKANPGTLFDDDDTVPEIDPRLLIVEPEWGRVLRNGQRQGNVLSAVVREAWDTSPLEVLTRADPLRAERHHVALVGHVTEDELVAELSTLEAANGFANRHLFFWVPRNRPNPDLQAVDAAVLKRIAAILRGSLRLIREDHPKTITFTSDANDLWRTMYVDIEEDDYPGIAGQLLARGSAQTLRLALVYALADGRDRVGVTHLQSAHAVWNYCQASVLKTFGQKLGDPVADKLLTAARLAGAEGLDGRSMHDALDRNVPAEQIERALNLLTSWGLVERRVVPPGPRGGRPKSIIVALR